MQSYLFPINAVLTDSPTGFIEFKRGDEIYLRSVSPKEQRRIRAVHVVGDGASPASTHVLDIRAIRKKAAMLDEAKYLVVTVNEQNTFQLALSDSREI